MANTTSPTEDVQISIRTQDGEIIKINRKIARMSVTIANCLTTVQENPTAEHLKNPHVQNTVGLTQITSTTFNKVVEWCEHHQDDPAASTMSTRVGEWEKNYMASMSVDGLFDVIRAANYLELVPLQNAACRKVGDIIRGKDVEELRDLFQVGPGDMSPAIVEQLKRENELAMER